MFGYWPIIVQLPRHVLGVKKARAKRCDRTMLAMRCCVEEASDI